MTKLFILIATASVLLSLVAFQFGRIWEARHADFTMSAKQYARLKSKIDSGIYLKPSPYFDPIILQTN